MTTPTSAPFYVHPPRHARSRQPVLVTGGTGTLGTEVVRALQERDVAVRVVTRRDPASMSSDAAGEQTQYVHADLVGGEGLAEAVDGVQAIVNLATDVMHPQDLDVPAARRLGEVAAANGVRLVHMSIVGCWDNPLPYYRGKAAAETEVLRAGAECCIVRATQFHPLVALVVAPRLGLSLAPADLRAAPSDPAWVARQIAGLAVAPDLPDVAEYAGPEELSARDLAVLTAHIRGKRLRRHVTLPAVGGIARAFARGANLPDEHAQRGGRTYAEWLADEASA